MATDISPRIGLEGEKEFKSALSGINNSLKTLGTEMKAVSSEFIGQEKSTESLTAANEVLTKQITAQAQKVDLLKDQLEKVSDAYGADSAQAQKLQQQLNLATADLNKSKAAFGENEKAAESLGEEVEDAGEKSKGFGQALANAGKVAAAGLAAATAAVGAVVGGIAKMTISAGYAADDLNTLAAQTGLSTETLQKFQFASEQIDVSVETMAGALSKVTKQMSAASSGTGSASEAFNKLGVSVTNTDGTLRDNEEVFNEVIAALGEIPNETERDALAMEIFGKSAAELNPLIMGGAEALQEYGEMAENAGLIMSQDTLDGLNKVSDAVDTFKATTSAAGNVLMAGFAEPLAEVTDLATGYIQDLVKAFQEDGVDGMLGALDTVIADITAKAQEFLPQVLDFATELVFKAIDTVIGLLPEIISMASSLMLTLIEGLLEKLPDLIDAAAVIIVTLANGISEAIPKLVPVIIQVMLKIVYTLLNNLDLLVDAALTLIVTLTTALVQNLPTLVKQMPKVLEAIVKGLISSMSKIWEVGKQIVEGIWEGIKGAANWIKEKVSGFFDGILGGVKKLLGIHSPSKAFAEIGDYMALGLGEGFEDGFGGVRKQIEGSIGSMVGMTVPVSAEATLGSTLLGGLTSAINGTNQDVVINITSEIDGTVLARNQYKYNKAETVRHGASLLTV